MTDEDVAVGGAETPEHASRSLDVGEQEGDRAGREVVHRE